MKTLIRRILKEETESDFPEKVLTFIRDIGGRTPKLFKKGLKWLIKNIVGHTPTKARLIFPSKGWETVAVEIIESLGIVTGTYKSMDEANMFFKELKNNGIVLEELMIGSHGSPGNLLSTQGGGRKLMKRIWVEPDELWKSSRGKEGEAGYWETTDEVLHESGKTYRFNLDFLEHIKPVVNSQTKVYFTACKGADKLGTLKEAAEVLGCECYACMGNNTYSFRCDESNWSCKGDTGIETLNHSPENWDQLRVATGIDDLEAEVGAEQYSDKKKQTQRIAKLKAKYKMWDMWVAEVYKNAGICKEQANVPFNWITIGS